MRQRSGLPQKKWPLLLKEPVDPSKASALLDSIFLSWCERINTPRSLAAYMLYQSKEHLQLLSLEMSNRDDLSVDDFFLDYLVTSFFKKFPSLAVSTDKEAVAYQKWLAAEASCAKTNSLFRSLEVGETPFQPHVMDGISRASRKALEILGTVTRTEVREHCRFGPGADLDTRAGNTATYNKFSSSGSSTPWVAPLFEEIFDEDHRSDYLHECQFVRGNRLSFVPKNAKTDRSICVEPRWNIYLQLGVGECISKRLLKYGIDLHDQSRNQEAAGRAYSDGLVTVDLSSASDTVSKNLVLYLLSPLLWSERDECEFVEIDSDRLDWLDLIFKSRSPYTLYKGEWRLNEKISSMGNGFTFPLETLIFYSFAYAACEAAGADLNEIRVYGDDIVVPIEAYPLLLEYLESVGFSLNRDKTFTSGVFFESCGHDFYKGEMVRPIFQKDRLVTIEDLYTLGNQIVDIARRRSNGAWADQLFLDSWRKVVQAVPKRLRSYGPIGLTGVLHASFDACSPRPAAGLTKSYGWEGWWVRGYVPVAVKFDGYNPRGHLYTKLSSDPDSRHTYTRRETYIWRKKEIHVPTWSDLVWR